MPTVEQSFPFPFRDNIVPFACYRLRDCYSICLEEQSNQDSLSSNQISKQWPSEYERECYQHHHIICLLVSKTCTHEEDNSHVTISNISRQHAYKNNIVYSSSYSR
jgi:hypothetical protein